MAAPIITAVMAAATFVASFPLRGVRAGGLSIAAINKRNGFSKKPGSAGLFCAPVPERPGFLSIRSLQIDSIFTEYSPSLSNA
jgi:hypothetical protein